MTALKLIVLRKPHRADRAKPRTTRFALAVALAALFVAPNPTLAEDFPAALKRVDAALRTNPSKVSQFALDSCFSRRNFAAKLYESRQVERANESLKFCFEALEISETSRATGKTAESSMGEMQAKAAKEIEKALTLTADLAKGLEIYRDCASCHKPEGWGLATGSVPQVAGQHHTVVIKQLADIRAGNRDNPMMLPHASIEAIGGPQAVADVAGYVDTLKMNVHNGKGPGNQLELGKRLYQENCARCHGANGEGDADKYVPRIQAQHYKYLVRQFQWIRDGKRRNANAEMVAQIEGFKDSDAKAVLDYVSRLEPPAELQAPKGWQNPDFAKPASK